MTPRFPPDWEEAFTADELETLARRTVDGTCTDTDALLEERLVRRLWEERFRRDRERREEEQ